MLSGGRYQGKSGVFDFEVEELALVEMFAEDGDKLVKDTRVVAKLFAENNGDSYMKILNGVRVGMEKLQRKFVHVPDLEMARLGVTASGPRHRTHSVGAH